MTSGKINTNLLPKSEAALRGLLLSFISESIPNLPTLREKEWAMKEMERLKNPNKIEGTRRNIRSTGVARKVDELGRFVIPKELRRSLGIDSGASIGMTIDDQNGWVVLEAYSVACHFCGSKEDINEFKEKFICEKCVGEMVESI